MIRGTLIWLFLGVTLSFAQPSSYDLAPDLLTLAKIKVRMNDTLERQPNYTCIEQIERSRRKAARFRYELVDNLRLEVALVDGHEMFAWPGSAKFEERDLERIVPAGGAIGNGNFALFARTIFLSRAPTYKYRGLETLEGRRVYRYDYSVSQMMSGLKMHVSGREAIVGFHGSFWADETSLDVWKLEVIADDIPPFLGIAASTTTVDYARLPIGQAEFLLPVASELVMTQISGMEDRNQIRFSACRQYTGESVLKFSGPLETDNSPAPPAAPLRTEVAIPAGVSFEVSLDVAIDSDKAMVGDTVRATLTKDMRVRKQLLMPKGAAVTGRIVRLERHAEHCAVDLQFSELEAGELHAAVSASLENAPSLNYSTPYRNPPPVSHSNDTGVILQKGDHIRLPRGWKVQLITGDAAGGRDSGPGTVRD